MYYFIPSWEEVERGFGIEILFPGTALMRRLEFDDTIHQIRIFQSENLPVKLSYKAYMPHAVIFTSPRYL